jgi:NAD(P)-dependent dehydrogenase (short-subunit alcohol dehydrogenase family)
MIQKPVVIVTGASRGVGASVARWLAKNGSAVILIARSGESLRGVSNEVNSLGGPSLAIQADICEPDACQESIAKTLARFGRINALVNNAGIIQPLKAIVDADAHSWRYNIEVNLLAPFYLTRSAVPELRKQHGRIVNVSSGAANIAIANASAYCAAKAALNHFTRVLAEEEPAVTAVAMRPGVVDTDMQALIRKEGPKVMSPEQIAYYQDLKDRGKLEAPGTPGRSIAWLALHAPPEFSGRFFDYDDPRISKPALAAFGETLD